MSLDLPCCLCSRPPGWRCTAFEHLPERFVGALPRPPGPAPFPVPDDCALPFLRKIPEMEDSLTPLACTLPVFMATVALPVVYEGSVTGRELRRRPPLP